MEGCPNYSPQAIPEKQNNNATSVANMGDVRVQREQRKRENQSQSEFGRGKEEPLEGQDRSPVHWLRSLTAALGPKRLDIQASKRLFASCI